MAENHELQRNQPQGDERRKLRRTETTPAAGEWVGYLIAIIINGVLLFVVRRLVDWDILPFLTEDFNRVVPVISLSLIASVIVNGLRLVGAPVWFALLADLASTAISLVATVRLYSVFPFDFDDEGFPWDLAVRGMLLIALFGTVVALIVVLVKLVKELVDRPPIAGAEA